MPRRYYSSNAVAATLTAGIGAGDSSCSVSSVTGWPTSYPFTLILGEDTASEELVTVSNVTGLTVTLSARGVGGTSAQSHLAGETVRHGVYAQDFTDAAEHIYATTTGAHGLSADLWSIGSATSFTPTWGNITVGNGTSTGSYIQFGKLVYVRAALVFGSTTTLTASGASLTVPVTPAAFQQSIAGVLRYFGGSLNATVHARIDASTAAATLWAANGQGSVASSDVSSTTFGASAVGDVLSVNGFYLAA